MDTLQSGLPRWLEPSFTPAARFPARPSSAAGEAGDSESRSFQLTSEESARFVRIVSECARIRRHYDIYRWLSTEVQHFLPHEVMLTAWGDFSGWDLKLDITSGMPGMRTAQLAHCRVDNLVRQAYARWLDGGRKAFIVKPTETEAIQHGCLCPIHSGLRHMRSMLVHGVHDRRSGRDSLFVAFSSASFTKGRSLHRFLTVLDPLVAQIDAAFRKVQAYALPDARRASFEGPNVLDLSTREMEVLESMCRGRTNLEIAAALDISPFTVKNHVQRIFRKIGVTNRTQAAARYADALRQAGPTTASPAPGAIEQQA